MNRDKYKRILAGSFVLLLVCASLFLASIPSDTLIEKIGAENIYVFMFLLALVGSISTFASIPYPLILIGLSVGGADPLMLGLASAFGVITSDTVTFFTIRRGRQFVGEAMLGSMERIASYIQKYPRLLTPGLMLYGMLSPLSNDFAVISLSLMRYSFFAVVFPLAVGNVIYNLSVAYLGVYAYDWIVNVL
jgi:uncharacterized membrane protein YdjX (TVP38/TMEM64 family)